MTTTNTGSADPERTRTRGSAERRTPRRGVERSDQDRQDYTALLEKLQTAFDERLARLATEPTQWVEFLEQAAVFGARYTLTNQMLLLAQAEERGVTPRYFLPFGNKAGTSGWKAHGRRVRRGQTAFKFWAPIRRRPTEEQAAKWEAAGRRVAREPSGRPAVQIVGFTLTSTFELSQTDGEPFDPPTVLRRRRVKQRIGGGPQLLTGDDPTGAHGDLVALITAAGYTVTPQAPSTGDLGDANGVTVHRRDERTVQVRDDVDPAQRTKTTTHELAHIRCGHLDHAQPGQSLHRGRQETEAESVAHIVLAALGLDTSAFSDAYVLDWAGGDLNLVRDCAETVLTVAKQILRDLTPDLADTDETDLDGSEREEGGSVVEAATVETSSMDGDDPAPALAVETAAAERHRADALGGDVRAGLPLTGPERQVT
ncbi:hypothetical protein [Cryptosporangium minutisporangium]|uniref:ImmA/IrrE family metallo-endopeptidase n=1 Tax=Cryptosporangium minutisporangium TaxID=113569 RepID=A0ABP6SVS9_9ACTN